MATVATKAGLPLWQPPSIKGEEALRPFRDAAPDLIVVVAYGQLLPKALLDLPRHHCINLHPSLLPKYRGPAPLHWAILNGDAVTGITTMYINEAMDAGDILLQEATAIAPMETTVELHDRLATQGAALMLKTIEQMEAGTLIARPQDPEQVVLAPMLRKADGIIDWSQPAARIIHQVRGLQPWPMAFTTLQGKHLQVFRAELPDDRSVPDGAQPGEVIAVTRSLHIATGDGRLCLTDLKLEGKKRMASEDFLRGHTVHVGERLS